MVGNGCACVCAIARVCERAGLISVRAVVRRRGGVRCHTARARGAQHGHDVMMSRRAVRPAARMVCAVRAAERSPVGAAAVSSRADRERSEAGRAADAR